MGRKGNFVEKTPRGPGRKAKKQKPPTLPASLKEGIHLFCIIHYTQVITFNL